MPAGRRQSNLTPQFLTHSAIYMSQDKPDCPYISSGQYIYCIRVASPYRPSHQLIFVVSLIPVWSKSEWMQVYREEKEAWLAGPLEGLAKNMRAVALTADGQARKAGRKAGALENCGGSLQRVFATAIAGSMPPLRAITPSKSVQAKQTKELCDACFISKHQMLRVEVC